MISRQKFAIVLGLSLVSTLAISNSVNQPGIADKPPTVHHVVLVDLKPTVTEAEMTTMIADGKASLSEIPGVLDVQLGLKAKDSRDTHIKDYDLALYVEFAQLSDLDVYGPHPKHQDFVNRYSPKIEKIRVIDFYGD
ncbi:MAG: Dabb family protein [Cyanothece sp. SIO1E1]|nr:Dabb family protein [Cyanothece sp. SIO1E1]